MQTFSCLREPKPSKYDLYIICDKKTSRSFAGHLGKSLADAGFSICKDEEGIEKSRVFIVVFSQGFAYSSEKLNQLVKIVEFATANRRLILTIFYRVDPSDVRHQTGEYGKALADHDDNPELHRWIRALREVAGIVGKHIEWVVGGKDESQYIEEMIQEVIEHVPCRIGLHCRREKVIHYLDSGSNQRVQVVGICGDPGSGKTTVAHEVYDCYADNGFDYYCIIDKGGEYLSEQGLLHLQKTLYCKRVGGNITEHENVEEMLIRSVLEQMKIFLIVEGIEKLEQLKAIDVLTRLFGFGSKVIITSRQKSLLEEHGIRETYNVEMFNDAEIYEFLCLKICNSRLLKANFVSTIKLAATFSSKLPLDLEIMGANLRGKGTSECRSTLDQYEKMFPNIGTQEILQISFDALEETQQQMLIYIARNLREQELEAVEDILAGGFSGCSRENTKVLRGKSLIKINEQGQVTLHDSILEWTLQKASMEYDKREVQLQYQRLQCNHNRNHKHI